MIKKLQEGFTLIELLVVIAIISVLATVVFVALNPAERLMDARDARRTQDVQSILTAIHECIVDQSGSLTACGIGALGSNTEFFHIKDGAGATGCNDNCSEHLPNEGAGGDNNCVDLSTQLDPYLISLPADPGGVSSPETEYAIRVNSTTGIVTIASCSDEGIQVGSSR